MLGRTSLLVLDLLHLGRLLVEGAKLQRRQYIKCEYTVTMDLSSSPFLHTALYSRSNFKAVNLLSCCKALYPKAALV